MASTEQGFGPMATRRGLLIAGGAAVSLVALEIPAFAKTQTASTNQGETDMTSSFVTTKDGVDIFYKDWGPKDAQPIVFHHGWPLSSDDWDAQMLFFLSKGFRVVAMIAVVTGARPRWQTVTTWTTTPPTPSPSSSI